MISTSSNKRIVSIVGLSAVIILCCVVIYFEIDRMQNVPVASDSAATPTLQEGQVMMTPDQIAQKQAIIDQTKSQSQATLTPAQVAAKARLLKQLQDNQ